MITEVKTFQADNNSWSRFDTAEKAKDYSRLKIVEKYLLEGDTGEGHYSTYYDSQKIVDAKKTGYKDGFWYGRRAAITALIKFYPDIISKLNEIDAQKIEEKTNG